MPLGKGVDNEEDDYEILDIRGTSSKSSLSNFLEGVSGQSVAKQITFGSVSGMLCGFLFVKVGRVAAATLGSTILVIQIAQHQGYIQINWDKLRESAHKAHNEVQRTTSNHYQDIFQSCKEFLKDNVFLAAGFGGGFLIGMSF